jgi:D-alanyl-D-alanine carboxypeptidase (penicillin-binding protein 5/6)
MYDPFAEKTMRARFILPALILSCSVLPTSAQQPATSPLPPKAPADKLDGPPIVSAKAWVVADGKTGKMLWGGNETEPRAIASTSKIMTAWVVLQLAAKDARVLDEIVTFSERADKTTGTSCRLAAGEKVPVRDLLYGLLLPSGNDAAVALAEQFGSRFEPEGKKESNPHDRFVAEMNRTAAALKMTETKYIDPHGLGRNLSSARNLAVLAAAAFKDPLFRKYVGTRRHDCEVTAADGMKRPVTWENTNQLLKIEGFEGIKTGTTSAAGACLVSTGRHGDDHLIVVVLGCTSGDGRYVDSRNLYRWAWRERGGK